MFRGLCFFRDFSGEVWGWLSVGRFGKVLRFRRIRWDMEFGVLFLVCFLDVFVIDSVVTFGVFFRYLVVFVYVASRSVTSREVVDFVFVVGFGRE